MAEHDGLDRKIKGSTITRYKCGQPGRTARKRSVSIYNITANDEETLGANGYDDLTQQWYEQPQLYDAHWWNNGQTRAYPALQPHQLTLPAPQEPVPTIRVAAI